MMVRAAGKEEAAGRVRERLAREADRGFPLVQKIFLRVLPNKVSCFLGGKERLN